MATFKRTHYKIGGNFEEYQKLWAENKELEKGVLMMLPKERVLVRAAFGSGCNLDDSDYEDEDIDDYINISVVDGNDPDLSEIDGGQLDFASEKEDYRTNLQHFCEASLEFMDFTETEYHVLYIVS